MIYIYNFTNNYNQIINSIPTNKLPENLTVGRDVPDPEIYPNIAIDDSLNETEDKLKKGHILWLRGISRLQTQVKFLIILCMSKNQFLIIIKFNSFKYYMCFMSKCQIIIL